MVAGLRLAFIHSFLIALWAIRHIGYGGWRRVPRQIVAFGFFIPAYWLVQLFHWLGFALDEIFFRGYRQIAVRRPVFIVGVPRSGTTFLQRLLATHPDLTSMTLAESLILPSITGRYVGRTLRRLFAPIQRRLARSSWVERFQSIHRLGMSEAEEDFLALASVGGCCVLFILFPQTRRLWELTALDTMVSAPLRSAYLGFYRRMVQKHMYVHGALHPRYLAKNPGFTGWMDALRTTFPDAAFVVCTRGARQVVPSQLSSLMPAWELVHGSRMTPSFEAGIVSMLERYYRITANPGPRAIVVSMTRTRSDLCAVVREIADEVRLSMAEPFVTRVRDEAGRQAAYQSRHTYDLDAFHTCWEKVSSRFSISAEAGI